MIIGALGISISIPSDYEEIKRRLKMLGLSPTGNPQIDKSRLQQAVKNRLEKVEEKRKNIEKQEEYIIERQLLEEGVGAQALAEQNKIFFKLQINK